MSEREWQFYITDMIKFSETIISYTDGMNQQQFLIAALPTMLLYAIWN